MRHKKMYLFINLVNEGKNKKQNQICKQAKHSER